MKRIVSLLLVMVLMLSMGVTAFAADPIVTAPGTGTSAIPLTVAATTFSVSVPMSLPVTVDAAGIVTVANTAKIVNNSYGRVRVTAVAITGATPWSVIAFGTDMGTLAVNSPKIGFKLNTVETTGTGYAFNATNFPAMAGANATNSDEIAIVYDAKVPAQSAAVAAVTVANVVFTLAWDN